MIIDIEVTGDDIEKGYPRICTSCPVARAITRVLKLKWSDVVRVGWTQISINGKHYNVTEQFGIWIRNFDNGRSVEPFTFQLEIC